MSRFWRAISELKRWMKAFQKKRRRALKWSFKGRLVLKLNRTMQESFAKTFESFVCWRRLLELQSKVKEAPFAWSHLFSSFVQLLEREPAKKREKPRFSFHCYFHSHTAMAQQPTDVLIMDINIPSWFEDGSLRWAEGVLSRNVQSVCRRSWQTQFSYLLQICQTFQF